MNLTLIGMAGAGKSYVGKRLAQKLGFGFLDIDGYLEEQYGKELEKIVEEMGDEAFIEAEGRAIIEATSGKDSHIFSPGGSSIYEPEAMEHLARISRIVYLRAPFATVERRIGGSAARMGRIVGIRGKSFRQLFDERVCLYEKYAHLSLPVEDDAAETTVARIEDFLRGRQRSD